MANPHQDQAAGLRKLMAVPAPRIISIISAAASHDQSRLMTNLAASISTDEHRTLVVQASKESSDAFYGINTLATLLDVAQQKTVLSKAIYASPLGFSVAKLMQKNQLGAALAQTHSGLLNNIVQQLTQQFDILLVDASLNDTDTLVLPSFNEGEILIQLTRQAESIKNAYTLIKKIYSQLGRRSFGIIVNDASETQAQVVFNNISKVAKQYMHIDLAFFGAIPNDEHLMKANALGRSVVDAFPTAVASNAFKKIALNFDFKRSALNQFKQASLG